MIVIIVTSLPRREGGFYGGGGNNFYYIGGKLTPLQTFFNVFPLRVSFSVFSHWNFICIESNECPLQMYLMSVRLDFFLSIFTLEFPFIMG